MTFSVGCVLFQVFVPQLQDAKIPAATETWLAPTGRLELALLQIAPSGLPVRWPPTVVSAPADRELVAARLVAGLTPIA